MNAHKFPAASPAECGNGVAATPLAVTPTTSHTPQGNAVGVAANGKAQWSQDVCSARAAAAVPVDARIVPSPGCQHAGDPPDWLERGYGTGPRCIECRRNVSGCLCNAPDGTEDMTPVEDMKRIMPELFATGEERAERCAYLMGRGK